MRAILLILAFCAAPARADIIDGGNLIIGGQGIIGGTMTVQGSAFSVGGATFSVAGGSVTLGGRLNAAAAGIRWADGTTSTTAASGGGGGNVLLTATQTFSGGNVFTSSATAGPTAHTSTATTGAGATLGAGVFENTWMVVASTNPGGASGMQSCFYGLQSNVDYKIEARVKTGGASNKGWGLRFNNDTTNVHKHITMTMNTGGTALNAFSGNRSYIATSYDADPAVGMNVEYSLSALFHTLPGDATITVVPEFRGAYDNHSGAFTTFWGSGYYTGTTLSLVCVYADSGATMTGHLDLLQKVRRVR